MLLLLSMATPAGLGRVQESVRCVLGRMHKDAKVCGRGLSQEGCMRMCTRGRGWRECVRVCVRGSESCKGSMVRVREDVQVAGMAEAQKKRKVFGWGRLIPVICNLPFWLPQKVYREASREGCKGLSHFRTLQLVVRCVPIAKCLNCNWAGAG